METELEIPVRSTEVDFLGHVNNAKYLEYLEWGREDWYRKTGYSFEKLAGMGIGTVTVNVDIDYHNECGLGDVVIVRTRPLKTGRSSYVMHQEILKEGSGTKLGDARVTTVAIDMKTRKSLPIPEFLMEYLRVR